MRLKRLSAKEQKWLKSWGRSADCAPRTCWAGATVTANMKSDTPRTDKITASRYVNATRKHIKCGFVPTRWAQQLERELTVSEMLLEAAKNDREINHKKLLNARRALAAQPNAPAHRPARETKTIICLTK